MFLERINCSNFLVLEFIVSTDDIIQSYMKRNIVQTFFLCLQENPDYRYFRNISLTRLISTFAVKTQPMDLKKKNKNYMIVKRDIEDKNRRRSYNFHEDHQELFVDATRNVGVGFGAKDLKLDVKDNTRKRVKANSLTDIANDHEALCQRGSQLLRKGDVETALLLLNKSVQVFYKTSQSLSLLDLISAQFQFSKMWLRMRIIAPRVH